MEWTSFREGRSIGPVGKRVLARVPTPTLPAFRSIETLQIVSVQTAHRSSAGSLWFSHHGVDGKAVCG
jgi:hypothetical protein